MLKEMTPSTYNACFALSRAHLANLKTVPPSNSTQTEVEFLDAALEFARRAEDQREIADNPMLDELERTSKVRFHLFLGNSNAFLEYTIGRGLVQYVKGKLNQQPQLLPSERGTLLHRALGKPLLRGNWEINLAPMVQMLLKKGSSPNDPLRHQTVWHQFFDSYPSVTATIREHEYWRSILRLLLLRAANVQEAYQLFDLMMARNDMFESTQSSSAQFVRTVELLLSHGMDPNQSIPSGFTIWTWFLVKICAKTTFWEKNIVHGVTKAFIRYGADLTSCRRWVVDSTEIQPVSKALEHIITCLRDEERLTMIELVENEMSYLKGRDRYTRKSHCSRRRELYWKP